MLGRQNSALCKSGQSSTPRCKVYVQYMYNITRKPLFGEYLHEKKSFANLFYPVNQGGFMWMQFRKEKKEEKISLYCLS